MHHRFRGCAITAAHAHLCQLGIDSRQEPHADRIVATILTIVPGTQPIFGKPISTVVTDLTMTGERAFIPVADKSFTVSAHSSS
ncbi:hypothetical protein ACWPM1_05165 [Tsuneonella sp. HG249]